MGAGIGRARIAFAIGLVAACLGAPGCAHDDGRRFDPLRSAVEKTPEDERELGFEFDLEAQEILPLVDDLQVLELVNDMGQELVARAAPQPFVYRFRVVLDPELNAFAVPGGYVYLHSGTILAAGDPEELAGVLAHEIAHVKARHYARMVEQTAIPNLITGLGAIAAAAATGEPGLLVAAQAVNVALQIRYTRELEAEADRLGATLMTRAGYAPDGMVRFFERLVLAEQRRPEGIPPYLFTHPAVEDRIDAVREMARHLAPREPPAVDRRAQLADVQARLALLARRGRSALPATAHFDRTRTDPWLAEAERRVAAEDLAGALAALERAAAEEPDDPRVHFRRGELLERAGRLREAADAWQRTLHLDPTRALVAFRLGLVHRRLGEPERAIFYLDLAARHGRGELRERARWEIEKTLFPVVPASGVAASPPGTPLRDALGVAQEEIGPDAGHVVWWGEIGARFLARRSALEVRWTDPAGRVVRSARPEPAGRMAVADALPGSALVPGPWAVEVRFEGEPVETVRFRVRSGPPARPPPARTR